MKLYLKTLVLIFPLFLASALSFALSPIVQYNDLVAGEGILGFEDGAFNDAQFNKPTGLALNEDNSILYVADWDNNRIRTIDLNNKNKVQTLVGTGERGYKDGPVSIAMLTCPRCVAVLPGNLIAVSEGFYGGDIVRIRLVDLNTKTVSTLAGGGQSYEDGDGLKELLSNIWSMVYSPSDNCLYFSEPESGRFEQFNLKTKIIKTLLFKNPLVPAPAALCLLGDTLYLADRDSGKVYGMAVTSLSSDKPKPNQPISLNPVWDRGHSIVALAGFGSNLYAYDTAPVSQTSPISEILPDARMVPFGSVWGEIISKSFEVLPHFSGVQAATPVGFIADGRSDGRFYITNPINSIVTSFRDLHIGNLMSDGFVTEFTYPKKKPFRTYRILMCGRSYLFYESDRRWDGGKLEAPGSNIMLLMSKKLELYLNTLAALEDVPVHFEVFNDGRVIDSLCYVWPYYETPKRVKDYDIDLVMVMMDAGQTSMGQFGQAPMTPEGIPQEGMDPEYALKPDKEKYKTGPLREFFDLLEKRKTETGKMGEWPMDQLLADDALEEKMEGLMGRPLGLLQKKFDESKTSWGVPPRVCICYFPQGKFPYKIERAFWKDVTVKEKLAFVDMTDDFRAFRYTYSPISDMLGNDHFSKDGHTFMAQLLAHELIRGKIIPFKSADSP